MNEKHRMPEDVGKMATTAGVKALVMSHLSSSGKDNDDYGRFVSAANRFYSGRIIVAKELMELSP